MSLKKIIFICLILIILSITAVSAVDSDNINATNSAEPAQEIEPVKTVEHDNTLETVSKNKPVHLSNIKATSTSPGTFDDLQLEINNAEDGSVLVLTRDYNGHYGSRIHLDKDITIDGQGHTLDCLGEGGCSAFYSTAGNIVLKNIRIINGHHDYNGRGGAIQIEGSAKYTLENCIFENNWAEDHGGAIYNTVDQPLTIMNCTFNGNNAGYNGGAINAAGDVIIIDSIFSSNNAGYNGGVVSSKKSVYVDSSTFNDNTAGNSGGAIFAYLMICVNNNQPNKSYNSFFTNNKAMKKEGGALKSNSAFLKNTVFKINSAKFSGGAVYAKYETNCSGCLFESNKGEQEDGGAICVLTNGKASNIENSIFKSNYADSYGGAVASFNELNVNNSTFENNNAGFEGGAIWAHTLNLNTNQNSDKSFSSFFRKNSAKDDSSNYNMGGAIYTTGKAVIRNVYFGENDAKIDGGAIYSNNDNLYVEHCMFESNRASGGVYQCEGGAINANVVYVVNCTFKNNYADDYGGAIYAKNVRINQDREGETADTFFINNKAKDNDGGAIYAKDDVFARNVAFINNAAYVDGGAIYAGKNVEVIRSIFESNQANGAPSSRCYGGAIRAGENTKINNCNFKNNNADNRGGAVYASTVTIEGNKNTFEENSAKDYGGAIYTDTFTNDVSHVSFINNSAEDGGAVYINKENWITFTDCIFMNNRASNRGGAIYLDSKNSHLTIKNNVFINNIADNGGHTVFNYGYYDAISDNFWSILPTDYNNQLVEWKALSSNIQHTDSNPVRFTMEIIGLCCANATSGVKISFVHPDGTAATLPMIAEYFSMSSIEEIEIGDKEVSSDGITILFTPTEAGTYELPTYILGMTGIITINVIDGGAIIPVLPEQDIIMPDIPKPYIPKTQTTNC